MEALIRPALKMLRATVGGNSAIERFLDRQYMVLRRSIGGRIQKKFSGRNYTLFWSNSHSENRIGIYMYGSCDLPSVFTAVPLIHRVLKGRCCIIREGLVSDSRSDLLLQTLQNPPRETVDLVVKRLKLSSDYFQPRLFRKNFVVPGMSGPEEFPKTVIILSIAANVVRTVYRHRGNGLLVDPGGWWLNQSIDSVLADLDGAAWFRENFESIGTIHLDEFVENLTRIIQLLKENTNAHILVYNTLTVDPGNLTHNYQFVRWSHSVRRREFNLALVDLSRQLDFSIVDVDRIVKKAGIREIQMDFAHFPLELYPLISREVFRILRNRDVF